MILCIGNLRENSSNPGNCPIGESILLKPGILRKRTAKSRGVRKKAGVSNSKGKSQSGEFPRGVGEGNVKKKPGDEGGDLTNWNLESLLCIYI